MESADQQQERDLAERAAGGDQRAWQEIYETTCQPLFNFLSYQVRDREAAKDLLQETYLTAAEHLGQYRGEGSLLSWLRTIALRKSLDWKRGLWRRLKQLSVLKAETEEPPQEDLDARIDVQGRAFRRALRKLSSAQRAALILREMEDLSFRDIALHLGCQEATARVHYHRGRTKMQQQLRAADRHALAEKMGGQRA